MRIAVGHANPDFDAYASTIAATKLFDGAFGVYLGSQSANVKAFHNLHEELLDFVDLKDLDTASITELIVVDTHDPSRLGDLGAVATRDDVNVIIYDHHPPQEGDLVVADDRSKEVGATTSILVHELRDRGITLAPLEASVMLLGIHEDTGSLTYPGATAFDAEAAAWLMASGADIEVVNQFLSRALDPAQQDMLRQLESTLEVWSIHGQQVAIGRATTEEYVDSAGVLTHYVVEDLGYRVAVGVIGMPQRTQVVARSRLGEVDVGRVMSRLGGGGHPQAASAGFRDRSVDEVVGMVRDALYEEVRPPLRAADVMSSPVRTITPDVSMSEAGELMATWGHGGLPVTEGTSVLGLVTRKDVDKALRHRLGHAPVTGFMSRGVLTVGPDTDLREIEKHLATRGIGRVPVLSDGELVGIVTRKDVLRAEHGDAYLERGAARAHPRARARFVDSVRGLLPSEVREVLESLGTLSDQTGTPAHVVGGFVRDMVMGRRNLDVDIVVEGDGVEFALEAASRLGCRVKVHRRFGTAVLVVSRELHVDIASSRSEYYTSPGALPTVERSSLRQDLFRRDFTINALSACISPGCFGALTDPFGGLADIRDKRIRIMHSMSFIDDPTRVLRAARFEKRYDFSLDDHSYELARHAVGLGVLDEVSGARVRDELYDIFAERSVIAVLRRLDELGAVESLCPEGVSSTQILGSVAGIEDALASAPSALVDDIDRRTLFVAGFTVAATPGSRDRWVRHYRIGKEAAHASHDLASRGSITRRTLRDRRGMRDSRLYRLLVDMSAESLLVLWSGGDALVKERIERFRIELASARPAVSGRDLIAMGAEPGETFSAILAKARDDLLDGRAVGRTAELSNLRRLAARAGIIDSGRGAT